MRRNTRRIALCGLLSAMAVAVMLPGGVIPAAQYCCPILAMAVLLPIRIEFGPRTMLTAYAAVSILALLLSADKESAFVYLFLGWYPAEQSYFYRLRPRAVRLVAILAVFNGCVLAMYALLVHVFLPETAVEFSGYSAAFAAVLMVLGNVAFLLTDFLLVRLGRLWKSKLRRRWFREN